MSRPVNILHLHSTFSLGGKEARAVRLVNAFGDRARHTIVSSMDGQYSARDAIAKGIDYEIAQNPPPLTGSPSVKRYEAIAAYMRRFDLVLTYNWGAIDGAMARRVSSNGVPPLVHHEDGFNADEAKGLKAERNIYRRFALTKAAALVVPSETLETIALKTWKQPRERVHRIANGIATARYAIPPKPNAIPGFKRKPGELVIGTLAGLREVKNLPLLVRAFGGMSSRARLIIVGEGPERQAILDAAERMGVAEQLVMPGFLPNPHEYIGLFDIMALSSKSEQFPICVLEGMAAGLPIVSTPVGDVLKMVAPENSSFIERRDQEVLIRDALESLAQATPEGRKGLGELNRRKAVAEYDEATMIARYAQLYGSVIGRPGAFGD
ncbi:glycosyl transferase family 1 [Sphingomonas glacialis]|uniref:Glycosyl transferase family 1 n=1 Tax=Sphingomonas glacialis TaxID=658225 RepID=A0ABQ3LER4_9SPHN|nr:glycosyltransferase family 4 protein [Sphingomonas glacialis]GHH11787.1 glycosyl transferase family 1 [Sphingomonas glacialis]